jgi:hypothetical protein
MHLSVLERFTGAGELSSGEKTIGREAFGRLKVRLKL